MKILYTVKIEGLITSCQNIPRASANKGKKLSKSARKIS